MALVNSSFTVNVTPGAMPPIVHVSEYDVGRTYTVTINGENGSAFNIPTGTTATVEGTLNGVIGFTTDATISGSTVSFTLTESMTAKSGKAWCKIKLSLNDEPIQTCAFVLAVYRAGVEAETVIGASGFEEQITDAVDDYLAENPIPVDQEQIQDAVDSWFDDHGGALTVPMGHLDATSTATVMTATVDGITELRDGVCMWLLNGVVTSASGFTLNVNNLGAKPCYNSLAAATRATTVFNVNYTMLFVYNSTRVDGGCWDIVYGVDTNTTYTTVKLGFGYGTCTTAAATAAKTASISSYALTTGGIVSIHFDNDVPSGATLNISSKGSKAIYYRGAAITDGVITAGDTATFIYSTYYHLISIDRWGEDIADLNSRLDAITVLDEEVF